MMMVRIRRWRGDIIFYAIVVVSSVVLAFVIAAVVDLSNRASTAEDQADVRQQAVEILANDVETLREQIKAEGETPDAPEPSERLDDLPDEIIGPQGPQGFRGDRGPRGFPPSPADVMAAVVDYLRENPPEPGPSGADGVDGEDGETVVGPQGEPGPAGESIVGPQGEPGPAGTDGSDGTDGQDGRGISSVAIEGDPTQCEIVFTYTDSTSDRIEINGTFCA